MSDPVGDDELLTENMPQGICFSEVPVLVASRVLNFMFSVQFEDIVVLGAQGRIPESQSKQYLGHWSSPPVLVWGSLPQNKHGLSTRRNGNVRILSLLLLYLLSLLSTSNKGFEFEKLSLIFNPNINRLTLLTLQE